MRIAICSRSQDGVVVYRIDPSGPAAKSDLKASDVITSVDSQPVASAQELRSQVRSKIGGNAVLLGSCAGKEHANQSPDREWRKLSVWRAPAKPEQAPTRVGLA